MCFVHDCVYIYKVYNYIKGGFMSVNCIKNVCVMRVFGVYNNYVFNSMYFV